MDRDQFDERTERLLPCFCYRHLEPFREHYETCPAYHRPAVAAALREAGQREAELRGQADAAKHLIGSVFYALKSQLEAIDLENPGRHVMDLIAERDDLRREVERLETDYNVLKNITHDLQNEEARRTTEIAALKAKLAELRKFAEDYPCHCAQHYPGTTAYHGHDCENVVVQEFIEQWSSRAELEKKP